MMWSTMAASAPFSLSSMPAKTVPPIAWGIGLATASKGRCAPRRGTPTTMCLCQNTLFECGQLVRNLTEDTGIHRPKSNNQAPGPFGDLAFFLFYLMGQPLHRIGNDIKNSDSGSH